MLFPWLQTPKSRGFSGSTDAQPCTARFQWHRSLRLAGSGAAAAVWTGDKETARVSDGGEGRKERKNERGAGGGSQAPGCPLSLVTCLLDCAAPSKKQLFPPWWGHIEDGSWLLVRFLGAVAKAAEFLNAWHEKRSKKKLGQGFCLKKRIP